MTEKSTQPKVHIFQKKDDYNCGPTCLSMVYKLRGKQINVKQIVKDFHYEPKGESTYPPQLARHLLKHGLKTKLTIGNPKTISPAWKSWPKDQIIDALKSWLTLQPESQWHKYGLHMLFYLQEGGEAELKAYTIKDLTRMLDRGSLLIICIDEVWLWGHRFLDKEAKIDELKGQSHGHYVLVDKYQGKEVHVLDPYPTKIKNRHGTYQVDFQELLNASLIWSGTIIEVLP